METKAGERMKLVKSFANSSVVNSPAANCQQCKFILLCSEISVKYAITIQGKLYSFRDRQLFFFYYLKLYFHCYVFRVASYIMRMRFTTRISKHFYRNSLQCICR